MTAARARRRSRHARRWAIYACWGVLAVAVAVGAWVGVRGALAAQHLLEAKSLASTVQSSISKDPAGARAALSQLEADASEARALTSDPIWSAASHLPWIGPQLHAVSTLATALHATST
ncbi:MAG TPA: peptide synthetase, partial [Microbacterium ginsengisoli]|nr:peptide synthetase [Microbacterium ginsengisoli]